MESKPNHNEVLALRAHAWEMFAATSLFPARAVKWALDTIEITLMLSQTEPVTEDDVMKVWHGVVSTARHEREKSLAAPIPGIDENDFRMVCKTIVAWAYARLKKVEDSQPKLIIDRAGEG